MQSSKLATGKLTLGCNEEQHGFGILAMELPPQRFIYCNVVKTADDFNIPESLTLRQDLV